MPAASLRYNRAARCGGQRPRQPSPLARLCGTPLLRRSRIDRKVQRLIEEQHRSVCDLLTAHWDMLDDLVKVLLAEESIDGARLAKVLGPRARRTVEVLVGA